MEIFLPTLEAKITTMVGAFRFIVFAIMVIGLIVHMSGERTEGAAIVAPLVKAVVILTGIAFLDTWYPKVDETFLAVADFINPGYNVSPTSASDTVREATTTNPEGQSWSWRRINESIYQAVSNALAHIFIYIGTLLTVPMLILQYILKWLLYLLTPFALAIFMLPRLSSIGVRFFQQVLAIHAWPIGFALTNLVALAIWKDFRNAVGANPTTVGDALYSPLLTNLGGLLAAIVIFVGMISTPIVMQKLFVQGEAFSGASANPVSVFRTTAGLVRSTGAAVVSKTAALPPANPTVTRPGI